MHPKTGPRSERQGLNRALSSGESGTQPRMCEPRGPESFDRAPAIDLGHAGEAEAARPRLQRRCPAMAASRPGRGARSDAGRCTRSLRPNRPLPPGEPGMSGLGAARERSEPTARRAKSRMPVTIPFDAPLACGARYRGNGAPLRTPPRLPPPTRPPGGDVPGPRVSGGLGRRSRMRTEVPCGLRPDGRGAPPRADAPARNFARSELRGGSRPHRTIRHGRRPPGDGRDLAARPDRSTGCPRDVRGRRHRRRADARPARSTGCPSDRRADGHTAPPAAPRERREPRSRSTANRSSSRPPRSRRGDPSPCPPESPGPADPGTGGGRRRAVGCRGTSRAATGEPTSPCRACGAGRLVPRGDGRAGDRRLALRTRRPGRSTFRRPALALVRGAHADGDRSRRFETGSRRAAVPRSADAVAWMRLARWPVDGSSRRPSAPGCLDARASVVGRTRFRPMVRLARDTSPPLADRPQASERKTLDGPGPEKRGSGPGPKRGGPIAPPPAAAGGSRAQPWVAASRRSRRVSSRSTSARVSEVSFAAGARTKGQASAPRRCRISLRTTSPIPGCCS